MGGKKNDIDDLIADSVIGRQIEFSLGGRRFCIYPFTLGKTIVLNRLLKDVELNDQILAVNPFVEALRIAEQARDIACRLIAYMTCNGKDEVMNSELVNERAKLFAEGMDNEDIATLLLHYMTSDRTDQFAKHIGLDKDAERKSKVMSAKSEGDKNNYTFGGLSIFGTLIDWAAERYGWTKDYIVWGIDYTSLKMMQADAISSIYVTDDERKRLHISNDRNRVNGDDKAAVKQFINSQNWD